MWLGRIWAFLIGYAIVLVPTYILLESVESENLKRVLILLVPGAINGAAFVFRKVLDRNLTWYKVKHFFSNNPIHWHVGLNFKGAGYIDFSSLEQSIKEALSENYDVKMHHRGYDKLILMAGGVVVTASQVEDAFGLQEDKTMSLQITLEAESPQKTFKRKHYDKLIKRVINLITNLYGLQLDKVTLKYIDVVPKFIEDLEEREMLKVEHYKVAFEQTPELNLYAKNGSLVCVGRDLDRCFMKLEALV